MIMMIGKSYLSHTVLFVLLSIFGVVSYSCAATQPGETVTVTGAFPLENITKEGARRKAVEDALRAAVEQVVGLQLMAETLVVNARLSGDLIKTIPHGKVIDKQIVEEWVEQNKPQGDGAPTLMYHVKVKATIQKEQGAVDPYFKVDASLNRSVFKHKDKMVVKVSPTRDAYITIFNLLEDDKVCMLFPTQLSSNNKINAGSKLVFPAEETSLGQVSLKVEVPPGKKSSSEAIYILATKQPVHFDQEKFKEGICVLYDGNTGFISDLMREIVELPLTERTEKFLPYEVVKD